MTSQSNRDEEERSAVHRRKSSDTLKKKGSGHYGTAYKRESGKAQRKNGREADWRIKEEREDGPLDHIV